MNHVDKLLCILLSLVPLLCLLTVCITPEKEPPTYRDIWYGEDR
jgi:hypothetical protein